ncbi:MAG: 3-oxoacyl-ACP reductase FabG [candidate division KSB1 bacterium]|nr:3-oxoacyl-ACP reductase FabG [candidate division KSB1 bacterium]MDZ7275671.1 3-oxoacyl-ACP reductase FabG [candidate division KSB1 bacterium]MDZ7284638.1 3-oxoacyl-ACP reductase FabG [candidate division KSB1 bacterium]MDZ7297943.1 3-oxoacyl-ACP reductase FabG [candidate division KSB1 bacterium]MDZ7308328.1 3-oxoacyl-ACP reductase FabG [candidate division KSB1 bacterium]
MRLENKIALLTGGASGIGRVTAETFHREGAKVIIVDVNEEAGRAVAARLAGAEFEKVNVAEAVEVQQLFERVQARHGRLDVLVNNAGILQDARLVKMTPEQWQRVIAVNLTGVFLCGQAAARMMENQAGGGVILNAASVVGLYGNFGQSNYVASKAGVIGMTKVWARELGPKNIRVNAVAPGFIATEMMQTVPEKVLTALREKTPLRRLGDPREVANVYLFLASEEASFITGAVISVDGGLVA